MDKLIESAEFSGSASDAKKCAGGNIPEFAFVGRSNVGKSSLINMITGQKDLALTSAKPGKTQLINHFLINKQWYIVDLPGYGYAKVSKTKREEFGKLISSYLLKREPLYCVFVLIDSRLEPQRIDLDFIRWLGENSVPMAIAFTKTDKLGAREMNRNIELFRQEMLSEWNELPPFFITSAVKKKGAEEILSYIESVRKL